MTHQNQQEAVSSSRTHTLFSYLAAQAPPPSSVWVDRGHQASEIQLWILSIHCWALCPSWAQKLYTRLLVLSCKIKWREPEMKGRASLWLWASVQINPCDLPFPFCPRTSVIFSAPHYHTVIAFRVIILSWPPKSRGMSTEGPGREERHTRKAWLCIFPGPSLTEEEGQEWLESLAPPTHCTSAAQAPGRPSFIHTMMGLAFMSPFHPLL